VDEPGKIRAIALRMVQKRFDRPWRCKLVAWQSVSVRVAIQPAPEPGSVRRCAFANRVGHKCPYSNNKGRTALTMGNNRFANQPFIEHAFEKARGVDLKNRTAPEHDVMSLGVLSENTFQNDRDRLTDL
jgi:hypothetical protein